MEKKKYQTPTMEIVKLGQNLMLLTGSDEKMGTYELEGMRGYEYGGDPLSDE